MNETTFFAIHQFYYQSLVGITGFGGIFLLIIWFHAKKEGIDSENRRGIVFLALCLFSWTLPATIYWLSEKTNYCQPGVTRIFDRVLSESNNMFLVLMIPYFRHGFENMKEKSPFLKEIKEWIISVFIVFFAIILLFSIVDSQGNHTLKQLAVLLDTLISLVAICIMGYGLGSSFTKREYGKPLFRVTLFITFLMVFANIASGMKGFLQLNCEDMLVFQRWLSLLFLFSITCFTILIVSLANAWILEEKTNFLLQNTEKEAFISIKEAEKMPEITTFEAETESTYFIADEIKPSKIAPKESLFLKFAKSNDKYILYFTDLSKKIVAFPIILNENGKGKKLTQPYMTLLAYSLAKLTDNCVQEKASSPNPIHLPDIIAMNNQIRSNLLNPALKKNHFEEINKDDLLEREHQKAYQLRVPKQHIEIEIWEDMMRPLSELQEFMLKCGFSEEMMENVRAKMLKNG